MAVHPQVLLISVLAVGLTLGGSPSDAQQTGRGRWDIVEYVGQHVQRFESGFIKVGCR